ncbi:PaaI family thioesterase [uncultured Algimonas sp.]|uniref:PaaI family thioesterase n=1 Tax=uncultured Algimonas sp. TaxID=1547920 RepID=UPI00261E3D65|nr:PaaI family thioesterase [uncultured Algimonas sp.]
MTETIFDRLPAPPAAETLGWELIAVDPKAGTIELAFDAKPAFCNPTGHVQGGFLAAMLDDTMGPALFAMTDGKRFGSTIDLHVHYLRAVKPGRVTTKGRVVKLGARVAFLQGDLFDADGRLAATATASASLGDL